MIHAATPQGACPEKFEQSFTFRAACKRHPSSIMALLKNRLRGFFLILYIANLLLPSLVFAEKAFQETQKLTASYGTKGDHFGNSVAMNSETIAIGSYYDDSKGAVYIFEKNTATGLFIQRARLRASDGASGDYFGISVAISDDTVVVGAFLDDDAGEASGSVYLFKKPDAGWTDMTETIRLSASDGEAGDLFGISVAVSNDLVLVGAQGDQAAGNSSGSVYLFKKPTSGWVNMHETARLSASNGVTNNMFGHSVAISGDTIVVGSQGNNSYTGAVYLFEKPVSGWADMTETAQLTSSDGISNDRLGECVSISGNTVAAGAPHDNSSGSVYLFVQPAAGWANIHETARLSASDGGAADYFGRSVFIKDDMIAVGAWGDDNAGNDSGSVYLFTQPAAGWTSMHEISRLSASDVAGGDNFGRSVCLYDNLLVTGADGDDGSGSVYVWKSRKKQVIQPAILMLLLK